MFLPLQEGVVFSEYSEDSVHSITKEIGIFVHGSTVHKYRH